MRARSLVLALSLLLSAGGAAGQATPSPVLLVGEKSAGFLSIVDPATLRVVARVPANRNVHEIATDGRRAYISNSGALAITVVDLATRAQLPGIPLAPLSAIHGLWVADGKLWFANEGSRTIGTYDLASERIDWVLGTGQPGSHLIVVSPDGSRIFTTNGPAGTVSIIERRRGNNGGYVVGSVEVVAAGAGVEGLDVSPDGKELWAVNVRDRTITVIDVARRAPVATIPIVTTYSNRLKLTPDGRRVLVTDLRGKELMVFDVATRREIERIDLGGGAEGVLMAPDGSRAFVAVSETGRVAVIDLATLAEVGEVTGLENPDGMAWAAAR